MAKNPHPSGRPIRDSRETKKSSSVWWRCPLEQAATPRLRPKPPLPVADAIGYLRVERHADEDHVAGRVGFVIFPARE
jgi:hypothetical protein